MNKVTFFGLLLVLATAITVTTSLVYPPPVAQPATKDKIVPAISKDKESSSSSSSSSSEDSNDDDHDKSEDSSESIDDQEQILCSIIVRATHDLHVYQSKSVDEITTYLNTDCKNVGNEELVEQCRAMVTQHGAEIYEHVTNRMEMSQICKKIEDGNEMNLANEKVAECSNESKDKCRCCKMKVEKRKMRLRYIVKKIAKKRMCMCKKSPRPNRCREWIRRKERHALKKIGKICPYMICKHLGYCQTVSQNDDASKLPANSKSVAAVVSPSLSLELLDQRLEAHLTEGVCEEFEQLKALCLHLIASSDSPRYVKIYMGVFQNDSQWLDNDLREEVRSAQAGVSVNLCGTCKNVIQSSKDFYLQVLETVRNALDNTCGQHSSKTKCEDYFNKRIDTIKTYLNSLNLDAFCSTMHLCSASSAVLISDKDSGECTVCVQHLQPRKDAATQAVDRLSVYFTDLCAKLDIPQCQQLVSEVVTEARSFINEFDVQGTCMIMGFCGPNAAHDVSDFEHGFVEEIGKEVCSKLGSFDALCQQVIQGNTKQVQMVNLNTINIHDLFTHCEEETDEANAVAATTDECPKDKDKCQCCIDRVIRKKKCAKKHVARYVWHMLHLCKRCPAREKCEHHWEKKKECWDAKIDKVCPKKVCTRMGYCKKADTSSMCANMGPFKQACEQAFNTASQLFGEKREPLATLQISIQPKDQDEDKKQPMVNKP